MTTTKKNGFLLNNITKSTTEHYSPIFGYQEIPVTTLGEAVKDLALHVTDVEVYVDKAKGCCKKHDTKLTVDESGAIYLYTMQTPFHCKLNNVLRTENREEIKPWFAYLKLFITALQKLPSQAITVYRGVANDIQFNFENNTIQTWWTVNSCSKALKVIEFYLDGNGTVFAIETMHGKDIAMYSSKPDEQEVILMPGTRLALKCDPLEIKDRPFLVAFKECTVIPEGKHLMLSYHNSSEGIVFKIKQALRKEHITIWPDNSSDANDLHKRLADGVENAAVVCCFISADYKNSKKCKYELQYAKKRGKPIIPCLLSNTKVCEKSNWLGPITTDHYLVDLCDVSESDIHSVATEILQYTEYLSRTPQYQLLETDNKSCYLFELIRYEYERNSRIERLMNPAKSFSIDQSYINLSIVNSKEQHEKEKNLRDTQSTNTIMGSYEEIYGSKMPIKVEDIFKTCKNEEKQVLVFGRAGIGKSTFCRYIAYQWAKGSYWSQYRLLALIRLRRLTSDRYPKEKSHSLIDLVIKEVFPDELSEQDKQLLKKHFDSKQTLWILDGYDEIVQNIPPHLEDLLNKLLKTPHHILTSRPYLNTLSYNVQMEITGFTDNNIQNYVQQFFDQMKHELDDALTKSKELFRFLKANTSIWGIAHIPVNLELICSLWSNQDMSETKQLTITGLYTMITKWLCRRYLTPTNKQSPTIFQGPIEPHCEKELAFLEILAFDAMKNNMIIIRPSLLKKAVEEAEVSLQKNSHILNIGILKSFHKQGTGTSVEMDKDHYFIHLSFQEYFAARYLVNARRLSSNEEVIEFIQYQKYNHRYTLMFSFMSGLVSETRENPSSDIFWNIILGEPLDLVGIRHMQLVISCLEQIYDKSSISRHTEVLQWLAEYIRYSLSTKKVNFLNHHLSRALQGAQSLLSDETIINLLIELLQCSGPDVKLTVLKFIHGLNLSNPSSSLINSVITQLYHNDHDVRSSAWNLLEEIGDKIATFELIIGNLLSTLEHGSEDVRSRACEVLGKMGERVATNEVIMSKLMTALADESQVVRSRACEVLEKMGERVATNEVIMSKLMSALADESQVVRSRACEVLGKMGERVATNEVIMSKLMSALADESQVVRSRACEALGKMGERVATNELIMSKLVSALEDESSVVISNVCAALGKMSERVVKNEMILSKLVAALGDESYCVRSRARQVLGKMGERVATNKVIMSKLMSALEHQSEDVRSGVCEILRKMGENVATNEVIMSKLTSALKHKSKDVRLSACEVLGDITVKIAMNEGITSKLVSALEDESERVRENACKILGMMGEKIAKNEMIISKLVSALKHERPCVRSSACLVFKYMSDIVAPDTMIMSHLVSALEDESQVVRLRACEALGKMDERVAPIEVIMSKLMSALEHESEDVRLSACKVLGNISVKIAMNEGIMSKLVSALEDESERVRWNACEALGKMGERVATNEVIMSKLTSALKHKSEDVRLSACQVLGKMGERVATNEVIMSKLMSALEHKSEDVRSRACEVLGKMGERVATNEVIMSKLTSALKHKSEDVRLSACKVLGNINVNIAMNEGIMSKLVSALEDKSERVRENACKILGMMGEKIAKNEMIISKLVSVLKHERPCVRSSACLVFKYMSDIVAPDTMIMSHLVSALEDESQVVRLRACEALGKMGERVATNEVIMNKLMSALEDESERVRWNACKILGMMGEKIAKNEMIISKLVSALEDENERVRGNACEALGKMGERVATNEENMSKLMSALEDKSQVVRSRACEALGKMGEKIAKNEMIISKLVSALKHERAYVRSSACELLGNISKKVATNEVIMSKLMRALEHESEDVRSGVCEILRKMGEKVATNEVIMSKLVSALKDGSAAVRCSACATVGELGEKVVRNEVIMNELMRLTHSNDSLVSGQAAKVIRSMCSSYSAIMRLGVEVILGQILSKNNFVCLENVAVDQLVDIVSSKRDTDIPSALRTLTVQRGVGVIATFDKVFVYGKNEPIELNNVDVEMRRKLIEAYTEQANSLHLTFPVKAGPNTTTKQKELCIDETTSSQRK